MSDSPFTSHGDEPVEARIVSWVLGEASAFEAAELERLCGERPELLVFRRRMRALHGLLTEAEAAQPDEGWKLPPEKRKVLEEIFGEEKATRLETEKEKRVRRNGRLAFLAIAACLMLALVIAGGFGAGSASIQKARKLAGMREERAMKTLTTEFAPEHVEGTPRPSLAPNIERPVNEPAGGWSGNEFAMRTDAPALAPSAKPVPGYAGGRIAGEKATGNLASRERLERQAAAEEPQIAAADSLSMLRDSKNFGTGWGGAAGAGLDQDGHGEASAHEMDQPPLPSVTTGALATADPFADTNGPVSGLKTRSLGDFSGADKSAEATVSSPTTSADVAKLDAYVPAGGRAVKLPAARGMIVDGRTDASRPEMKTADNGQQLEESAIVAGKDLPAQRKPMGASAGAAAKRENVDSFDRSNPALTDERARNVDPIRRSLYQAEGSYNLGNFDEAKKKYEEALRVDPDNAAARRGLEKVELAKSDYYRAAYDQTRVELLKQVDDDWKLSVPADEASSKLESQPKSETDNLGLDDKGGATIAKPKTAVGLTKVFDEIPASEDPYSTFSLNISDASFQIAQAALAKGEQPDPVGIKVEQFYNAVDYGDPAPAANEPVAVSIEQAAHPVIPGRNLVRIALKTAAAGRSASQPLRLTLLVDQSGSMVRDDRRVAMDKALAGLAELLTKNDLVTVIGFARTPHLLADGMSGDKAGKLADLVNQAASEGGTNLEEAIRLGERLADRHKLAGAQNRIVLFTDGAANLGDANPGRLAEMVKQLRQNGIAFDIAGIAADGLNDELLGELARNGNGRYYVVGKGVEANFAKQLAGAFRPAAENVKVQVRFNPERVGRYKLIGFEKDRLKTEDFRNDKVDAAELAAEEAGVAIYQIEPLPDGNGEIGEVSVRFRDTASERMVERAWTIPHDAGAPAIDRATPSMQLAVLSMLAGEKLKGGPLADAIDFKQLTAPAASVRQFYGNTGRVGEMLRMLDALK